MFPGYVFFKPPPAFRNWDLIRWAPGVRRVLQEDGRPGGVPELVVEHVHRRLQERSIRPGCARFKPGDQVVIQSGPLRMVDAIFERELDASTRVRILVELLGRPVSVEVDPLILRAAG